jgi:hypothetical protein
MQLATIQTYSLQSGEGTLQASDGDVLNFRYEQGQNMMTDELSPVPRFTGRHCQPLGYQLKPPEVGDLVLCERYEEGREIMRWGYVTHYDMLARRHLILNNLMSEGPGSVPEPAQP